MSGGRRVLRIGLCQVMVGGDKTANLQAARIAADAAARQGATLIVLPECFNCPYSNEAFPAFAEPVPDAGAGGDQAASASLAALAAIAKRTGAYIVGGSMPERNGDEKLYNTCVVVSPDGNVIAKHRKVHLFNVDIPGKITFRESDTLSPGHSLTSFSMADGTRVGIGICYDIRFSEFCAATTGLGCDLLVFPGAFNMTTGPAHWELLQRARAVDNQVFVATVSPARSPDPQDYQAWGHSSVCDPWGTVIATTGHDPDVVIADLDLDLVGRVRNQIPIRKQKRPDVYKVQ
ncbi:CN hydrolase domain-containing protein [Plasmodiophora brassicae]|nr:hypothetical protein PBRA_003715 [Plasmodiophora brassicae]